MSIVKLKGITWDHSRGFDPLVAASKEYLAAFGVEISWEKRTLKDFGDRNLEDIARVFDLLIIDHPHSGVASHSNCILPLDQYIPSSDFNTLKEVSAGPSFNSYNYQGHQWAIPIDAALQTAVYRPDLLKSKVPEDWQEVLKTDMLGMALCPTDSVCSFLSISAQLGAPIKIENKELIRKEKGVEVLELLKEILKKSHPNSIHWNPIQLLDYMAVHSSIAYAPLVFCYSNYSREDYRDNKLLFTAPPTGENTVLGGAGIAVSAKCKNTIEAVKFSSWICSEIVQKKVYVNNAGQPGNIKAWDDLYANIITNKFFISTKESLLRAYVRPRFTNWPKFQEYFGDVIHECLSKNLDNEKVITHLSQEFEKIRPRVGYEGERKKPWGTPM